MDPSSTKLGMLFMIKDFARTMSTRAAVIFFTAATWTHVLVAVLFLLLSTKIWISLVEVRARRDDGRLVTGRVCFGAHVVWFGEGACCFHCDCFTKFSGATKHVVWLACHA